MNRYHLAIVCLFSLGINFAHATFEFVDEKTDHTLSIIKGDFSDWERSKAFYTNFHKPQYDQIPLDERKFETVEMLTEKVFADHYTHVFDSNDYKYYIIRDGDKFVGHFIVHMVEKNVYGIETQGDIKNYSPKSFLLGFVQFIKQEVHPEADCFIVAARKAVQVYGQLLKSCGFTETDEIHHDFYKLGGGAEYQSYKLKLDIF